MKKLLSIIGTISFITSGSSNLIACNNTPALTSEKLAELKEKNSKTIDGNKLEWIAPQEKPFDTLDNKWYLVVWRGDKNADWNITKFKNDTNANFIHAITLEKIDEYYLYLGNYFKPHLDIGAGLTYVNLYIYKSGILPCVYHWDKNNNYFKAVYRWDEKNELPLIKINSDGEIEN